KHILFPPPKDNFIFKVCVSFSLIIFSLSLSYYYIFSFLFDPEADDFSLSIFTCVYISIYLYLNNCGP
ncbi:hypothetical protein BDA99DRAFT_461489, partial [Phascolomyces articulosus]